MSAFLDSSGQYFHWSYTEIWYDYYNTYYDNFNVYLVDTNMMLDVIESFLVDYEGLYASEFIHFLDQWMVELGRGISWAGLLFAKAESMDFRLAIASVVIAELANLISIEAAKDRMLEDNATSISDLIAEMRSEGLPNYLILRVCTRRKTFEDNLHSTWEGIAMMEETNSNHMSLLNGVPNHQTIGNITIGNNSLQKYNEIWNDYMNADEIEVIEAVLD